MKRLICFILAAIVACSVCGLIVGRSDTSNSTVNATGFWSGNVSKGGWGNYQYNHICIIAGDAHQ